ncbi:MAG: DUF2461 domain-containing protein [Ignavibacteriae bacterium]|nr:DUF2461 domain-containing protein [Ignavibacteria bacterium]MBI3365361.1 DUF2461 domain-containing protein [Ignavibacteriota bacterium]
MRPELVLDADIYPPFNGFSKEGLQFLRRLKRNNNRDWFAKHKSEYENFVKLPMQCFSATLKAPMAKLAPEIDVNPKRGIFRIYRDTRFSKDKTPYKTHVAAVFHLRGHWEASAGYYVHIEPGNVYVGGGIYMPDGHQLKKLRSAIAERSDEFLSIVERKSFEKLFRGLEGEKLQRAPLGYPADHPMVEWLKHKSFYTGVTWEEKTCHSPKFVDRVVRIYSDLLPLIRFLNSALGK